MAYVLGDKKFDRKLARLAAGSDVTKLLLREAEQTRADYVESINSVSGTRKEMRYNPSREVTVSNPGAAPNSDQGDLVNGSGVNSTRKNQAEVFSSAEHAVYLELGTASMAPRPALGPAYEKSKTRVLESLARQLRKDVSRG